MVAEISKGGTTFAFQADVSVENDVLALFNAAEAKFGQVTHLVNNAGIYNVSAETFFLRINGRIPTWLSHLNDILVT